jgi:hypothetical protein
VRSSVLDDTVIFARDGAAGYPEGKVVYTLSELKKLCDRPYPPEELLALHRAKRAFPGSVVETPAEVGFAGDPFPEDPRPDLKEDSLFWERLLRLAAGVPAAQRALAEARKGGTRLRFKDGRFVLRPQVGEGSWPSAEAYLKFRSDRLAHHADEIAGLLEWLKEDVQKIQKKGGEGDGREEQCGQAELQSS